jgi:hypothetical protein
LQGELETVWQGLEKVLVERKVFATARKEPVMVNTKVQTSDIWAKDHA